MSCIQKVAKKVEKVQNTEFKNLVIWSNGCATEFRSNFCFVHHFKNVSGKSFKMVLL